MQNRYIQDDYHDPFLKNQILVVHNDLHVDNVLYAALVLNVHHILEIRIHSQKKFPTHITFEIVSITRDLWFDLYVATSLIP